MKVTVDLVDQQGVAHHFVSDISWLKFLKHASFAGQGQNYGLIPKIFNTLGLGFAFYGKFKFDRYCVKRMSTIYDPDEIGNMSRTVGRAVADIYAKSHFGANYTLCYEHCLVSAGVACSGSRPDFLCFDTSNNLTFSLEAKGSSDKTVSLAAFKEHKKQAAAGPLPKNFSVASVTHAIYEGIVCRIEDPIDQNIPFDEDFAQWLIRSYLRNVHSRLTMFCREHQVAEFADTHVAYDVSAFLAPHLQAQMVFLVPRLDGFCADRYVGTIDEGDRLYMDRDGIGVLLI